MTDSLAGVEGEISSYRSRLGPSSSHLLLMTALPSAGYPSSEMLNLVACPLLPLTLKITEQERAKRHNEVQQALASVRLEGLEPGDEAQSIYQRYAVGELTLEQMGAEIEALHDREHGPVPIPRNERP